jgi:hypothetical protein
MNRGGNQIEDVLGPAGGFAIGTADDSGHQMLRVGHVSRIDSLGTERDVDVASRLEAESTEGLDEKVPGGPDVGR